MTANKSVAQRLGRVLERVTRQSGRLSTTPDYGSWLLGRVNESQRRRRVRIQVILTLFVVFANLHRHRGGDGAGRLRVPGAERLHRRPGVAHVRRGARRTSGLALVVGIFWVTRRIVRSLRWAIEERPPTATDQRNTFVAPWRVAEMLLVLWGVGTALLTTLYGLSRHRLHSAIRCSPSVSAASWWPPGCYLFTEFALRPVAAQALEAGPPPRRLAAGIMGRTMLVWLLGSGVPVLGIVLAAVFAVSLRNLTQTQFAFAVLIIAAAALVFGFVLMWLLSWLTATPVRVVRAALKRVEEGDLDSNVVVFDGTELGELQRGFNSMVHGLRERERIRDLFGRHVGREVAAAAEQQRPKLGGEERHVAVIFVDIIGSTQLVTGRPATEVVELLNRFFAVIVDEVDRHHGFVNKFEGDAALAVFGAPIRLDNPEDDALAAGTRHRPPDPPGSAGVRGRHRGGVGPGGGGQRRGKGAVRVHGDRRTGERGRAAVRTGQGHRDPAAGLVARRIECERKRACTLVAGRHGDTARARRTNAAGRAGLVRSATA